MAGTVDWQRHVAEGCVRRLSGVLGVTNSIALRPRVSAAAVKGKIKAALKHHAGVEAKAIRVSVKDGDCVVPEGKVDISAEQHAAKTAAWSAPGVVTLEDHLTVV